MKNNKTGIFPRSAVLLFTAIILGLAWAARGSFGHEQGAAWAGAMGTLALLAVSQREDWLKKAPVLMALGGIGWAVGGMMSYGVVLAYAMGNDLTNIYYGLTSIALLGALYGFIGGGFFALGIESTDDHKPNWAALVTEMFVGGFLIWGFFIYQLEWFMTPPRSELWAAVLGAAIALAWHLHRNGYHKALRVAGFTALGAGFGFSFGNFLMVAGRTLHLSYNWWNVMEFLIGFLGGLGMAYAVITTRWPKTSKVSDNSNWFALLFIVLFVPLINYAEQFTSEDFIKLAGKLHVDGIESFVAFNKTIGLVIIAVVTVVFVLTWKKYKDDGEKLIGNIVPILALVFAFYYIVFTILNNGLHYMGFPIGDSVTLYLPLLFVAYVIWYVNRRKKVVFADSAEVPVKVSTWLKYSGVFLIILFVLALIILWYFGGDAAPKRFK